MSEKNDGVVGGMWVKMVWIAFSFLPREVWDNGVCYCCLVLVLYVVSRFLFWQ